MTLAEDKALVRENGLALGTLPIERRVESVALLACKQNGLAIQFVPDSVRTPEMEIDALRSNHRAAAFIRHPDYDTVIRNARRDPGSIRWLPWQDENICLVAVKADNDAAIFVRNMTPKIRKLIRRNWKAPKRIPERDPADADIPPEDHFAVRDPYAGVRRR